MFYASPVRKVRLEHEVFRSKAPAAVLHGLLAAALLLPGCGPQPAADEATRPLPDQATLCERIARALAGVRDNRRLDASVQGAWQVVHGILAFGRELPLAHDDEVSPALDYVLKGGRITGWRLRPDDVGVVAIVEEGSTLGQGHPDQWLGYLSQCGVSAEGDSPVGGLPLSTPLQVGQRQHALGDLLTQAQHDIRPGQESSWTLMALAAYLPLDASWEAGDGRRWTTEDVVRMEAEADIVGAACGGTHRLYGLAAAVRAYRAAHPQGPPPGSGWAAAEAVLADCIDQARRFQQPDGSFSVHYFERPGASPDVFATLGTTGHVFEILALVLDPAELRQPWVTRAAERLVSLLERTADIDVECGGLYHAAHGLAIYRRRLCQGDSPREAGDRRPAARPGRPAVIRSTE